MLDELVSVVMPCYKQAAFMDEALQSVLEQTYTNWECMIVNDGSPDETAALAAKWVALDRRFKYLELTNGGVCRARNQGIVNANGQYIFPLDADDRIGPDYISLAVNALRDKLPIKVVYCRAQFFGGKQGEWQLDPFSHINLTKGNMIFCSALFRKSDWQLAGGYDENMVSGLEDWEFWMAMLKNGGEVVKLEYNGFFYRIKESSRNANVKSIDRSLLAKYVIKKHHAFYVATYQDIIHKIVGTSQLLKNNAIVSEPGTMHTGKQMLEQWSHIHNGRPPQHLQVFLQQSLSNCQYLASEFSDNHAYVLIVSSLIGQIQVALKQVSKQLLHQIGFINRKKLLILALLYPNKHPTLSVMDKLGLLL